jgi:3-hydroxyisobutyrate dehydrogenase
MTIAFFGAGLMGSGFVRRLRANGEAVQVWNRNPARALALQDSGAVACADAATAVVGARRIHLSLSDDAAVDAVLEPLAGLIPADTWIVDHTTTAVRPTAERIARWRSRGRVFVHAPVFMGPANAADGTGLMLVTGDAAHKAALLPDLQRMTGKVVDLGPQPERAAAFKLFGNLSLLGMLGVLGDVARLAQSVGITTQDAFALFQQFNPGAMLPARADKIAHGDATQPSFEVAMARKDVRLMIEEAQRGGVDLLVMPGVAAMLDASIARGEAALDCTAAARVPQ